MTTTKFAYLCLALTCGLLAVSAQRPLAGTTTSTDGDSAAAGGPTENSNNPNITRVNVNITSTVPTTITNAANSTSPFTLARLAAIERAHNNNDYPTQNYTLFLADIHFIGGNLSSQYIAYHYCHFVSADFMQCALYNGREPNSRFIGNEYFITQAIFNTLPNWERNLWHSHPFEVQSGLFVAPDLTNEEELEICQWLMGTFGKVTDTWPFFEDFPIGPPQAGVALSLSSQVNWTVAAELDRVLNMSTTYQERQQQRAGLVAPPRTPGADNYIFTGYATNYQIYTFPVENNATLLGAAGAVGPAVFNATAPVGTNITLPAAANVTTSSGPSPQANQAEIASLPNPFIPNTVITNT